MKGSSFQMGEITGTLKGIESEIADIKTFMKNYENRVGHLENWRSQMVGIIIGISTVVTVIGGFISSMVQKVFAR